MNKKIIISNILNGRYKLGIEVDLESVGEGLDFFIYRGYSKYYNTEVAIRVPRHKRISYGKENYDSDYFLEKEFNIYKFMYKMGLPVPFPFFVHKSDDISFLVYEYLNHDLSTPDIKDLARVLNKLRDLNFQKLESTTLKELEKIDVDTYLLDRIQSRLEYLESSIQKPLVNKELLLEANKALASSEKRGLLHLDLRKENILTKNNKIIGIIDWSYSMVGDPLLEIFRLDEFSLANDYDFCIREFFKYYNNVDIDDLESTKSCVYRLDAALMVALVFLENTFSSYKRERQINRTLSLIHRIEKQLQGNY